MNKALLGRPTAGVFTSMYTFPVFSFTVVPPIAEQPTAVKRKHSPREAFAHFSLFKHPHPGQTLACLLHFKQASDTQTHMHQHKAQRAYTRSHDHNAHTHADRRGGELMHCYPQQDCGHSRNKYPILIMKFLSCASLSVVKVPFLVKNIHT